MSVRVLLVGDSTVTEDAGWGLGFRARLMPGVDCVNRAKGGRSSKSYRDEGHWREALAVGGDHVLFQFGHNDEPGKGPERETDPDTEYAANLARYVTEAREAGMRPVLVTSLTRRQFDESGRLRDTLAPYAAATRRVARELDTPLVDLHEASTRLCVSLGPDGCAAFSPDGKDRTHLNPAGAEVFGALVADLVRESVAELRPHVTSAPA